MEKKDVEIECLNRILKDRPSKGTNAYYYYEMISSAQIDDSITERPDIVLLGDEYVIGLEHCLVDGLYNEHKDSFSRTNKSKIRRVVSDYSRDQNLDNGVEKTKEIIKDRFDSIERFNYTEFTNVFRDVCLGHNKKCYDFNGLEGYKSRISTFDISKKYLGCLIEIPLPDNKFGYEIISNNKKHIQVIKNVPFTKDMIDIISKMDGFDFVVVCAYTNSFSRVSYFNRDIRSSLKEQNIKLVDGFNYYQPFSVDNIEINKGDGEYTFNFKGRLKK